MVLLKRLCTKASLLKGRGTALAVEGFIAVAVNLCIKVHASGGYPIIEGFFNVLLRQVKVFG